jgi:hypothetical protein
MTKRTAIRDCFTLLFPSAVADAMLRKSHREIWETGIVAISDRKDKNADVRLKMRVFQHPAL